MVPVLSRRLMVTCLVIAGVLSIVYGGKSPTLNTRAPVPAQLGQDAPSMTPIPSEEEEPGIVDVTQPSVTKKGGEGDKSHPSLVHQGSRADSTPRIWMWRRVGLQRDVREWEEVKAGRASEGVPQQALVEEHRNALSAKGADNNLLVPIENINTRLRIKPKQIGLRPLLGELERLYPNLTFGPPSAGENADVGAPNPICDYAMPNRIFIDAGARSYDKKSSVAHFQRIYPHSSSFRCIALELLDLQQTYTNTVKSYFRGHELLAKRIKAQQDGTCPTAAPSPNYDTGSSESVTPEPFTSESYPGFQYVQKAAWTHNDGVMITGRKMAKVSDDSDQITADPDTGKVVAPPTTTSVCKQCGSHLTKWLAPSVNLAELIYKEVGVLPPDRKYTSHTAMMADVKAAEEKGLGRRFQRASAPASPPKSGVRTSDVFSATFGTLPISSPLPAVPSSFVVLKIDIEGGEWRLLPYLIQSGIIPHYIDEVLLECHALDPNIYSKIGFGYIPQECTDLTNDLRAMGVYAHRWI